MLCDNGGAPTGEALHASALVVVLQVLTGAAVFARRREALVDVLLAAVARVACPQATTHDIDQINVLVTMSFAFKNKENILNHLVCSSTDRIRAR